MDAVGSALSAGRNRWRRFMSDATRTPEEGTYIGVATPHCFRRTAKTGDSHSDSVDRYRRPDLCSA